MEEPRKSINQSTSEFFNHEEHEGKSETFSEGVSFTPTERMPTGTRHASTVATFNSYVTD
jgi:hypothetical protein